MSARKAIPISIKRALLEETIYRCASCLCSIEYCQDDDMFFRFDEKAHISPHSETQDDSFENLITLCPNCHTKYDKMSDSKESLRRLRALKGRWLNVSGRFTKLEIDCLLDLFEALINIGSNKKWIYFDNEITKPDGSYVKTPRIIVQRINCYLYKNIEQVGFVIDKKLPDGDIIGTVAEYGEYLITNSGIEFCKKFLTESN
jgi:HNH endonuclease